MTKNEFLIQLIQGLSSLPQSEIEDRVSFYSEMIADRMEEGLSEEEAVADIGGVETVVDQIIADTPLVSIIKERIKRRKKLGAWGITLIAVGSPIWISLIVAAFAVVIAAYASIWAVVVSLWASFAAMLGSSVGGVLGGILFVGLGKTTAGFGLIGAALVCGGLSILTFYGCKHVTVAMAWLTKKIALFIKKCFTKKEKI
jgi:uncharacterized membrane protein